MSLTHAMVEVCGGASYGKCDLAHFWNKMKRNYYLEIITYKIRYNVLK